MLSIFVKLVGVVNLALAVVQGSLIQGQDVNTAIGYGFVVFLLHTAVSAFVDAPKMGWEMPPQYFNLAVNAAITYTLLG